MKTRMKVSGLRELERNLKNLEKTASKRSVGRNALKAGAKLFVETAKSLAPDNPATGEPDLHRGIGIGTRLTKRQRGYHTKFDPIEVFAGVVEGIGHGPLQEFGTINHAPRPFMRPSWDRNKKRALVVIRRELWTSYEKAIKRQRKRQAKKAR